MTDMVLNVVLGLLTSAIGAALGWLAQSLRRRRRLERTRAFFGLPRDSECLIVVNRSVGTGSSDSTVTRRDAFALMELAGLVKECGAQIALVAHDSVEPGLGRKTELCVGGPVSNERMAVHLPRALPGLTITSGPKPEANTLTVGGETYVHGGASETYALVARFVTATEARHPVFLVCGLTGVANHAGVRYLANHHRTWARKYGTDSTFAIVLRVVNPKDYGPDQVEFVADVTAAATARPPVRTAVAP